jgi:hypothetical protein
MFTIHSTSSDRELTFLDLRGEQFTFELRGHGLQVTREVSTYTDPSGLLEFFTKLGSFERPWEGSPAWASLEDEFRISASCSKLGAVIFSLKISGLPGIPEEWQASFSLTSELGQLPKIANAARSFFRP